MHSLSLFIAQFCQTQFLGENREFVNWFSNSAELNALCDFIYGVVYYNSNAINAIQSGVV